MTNHYILQPKASSKCDICKTGKKYKYIVREDFTRPTPDVRTVCKKCYNQAKSSLS